MENNDNYKLSTWGILWRYLGIERHTKYGIYCLMFNSKYEDYRDWFLYWFGFTKVLPPLIGESQEDFYIPKIFG